MRHSPISSIKKREDRTIKPHFHTGSAYKGLSIGLLGGSFNPAHAGHRAMSLYALKRLGLDQIWWLVSPQNPLKPTAGMADFAQRFDSAKAIAQHPRIVVTGIEGELGTVYTADTLRALRRHYPQTRFVWLMGADNLRQIPRWRMWQDIFQTVPVAVFRRPAYAAGRGCGKAAQRFGKAWHPASTGKNLAGQQAPAWLIIDNLLDHTSSTRIRKDRQTWPK